MRFVIAQQSVKRRLEGAFRICASRQDFETLVRSIEEGLRSWDGYGYGWLTVFEIDEGGRGTEPIGWREGAE